MKKFKIAIWLILIILLILIFFQNKAFLLGKQALVLDLFVADEMQSFPLPIAVWFLAVLCVGFLFGYIPARIEKFKTGRMIKALKSQVDTQTEMIGKIKSEMEHRGGYQADEIVNVEPGGPPSGDL